MRLTRYLLWLLLSLSGVLAHAYPATRTNPDACTVAPCPLEYEVRSQGGTGLWFGTALAACNAFLARQEAAPGQGGYNFPYQAPGCKYNIVNATSGAIVQSYASETVFNRTQTLTTPTYSCPAGSTLSGSQCTCNAPSVENAEHNGCVAPNFCSGLTGKPYGPMEGSGNMEPKLICNGGDTGGTNMSGDPAKRGCVVKALPSFGVRYPDGGGSSWHSNSSSYTGAKCDPDAAGSGDAPDSGTPSGASCPIGQVAGMVNGSPRCYTPDVGSTGSTEKKGTGTATSTAPDGTKTDTTIDKSVKCEGGTCTTTVTKTVTRTDGVTGTIYPPEKTTVTTSCQQGTPGCGTLGSTTPKPIDTETTTTKTTGPTVTNPDGTTTTKSSEKTTGTNSGSGSGSGSGDGESASICEENPNSLMCAQMGTVKTGPVSAEPELYSRKYPDGLAGVWNTRSAQMASSPLVQLTTGLQPTIANGAGYPVWNVPLTIGKWSFGTYDVSPPPLVWDFLKVCVMVSALFLARALIFGG